MQSKCVICSRPAEIEPTSLRERRFYCPSCGEYEIDASAGHRLQTLPAEGRGLFAGIMLERRQRGLTFPSAITPETLREMELEVPRDMVSRLDRTLVNISREFAWGTPQDRLRGMPALGFTLDSNEMANILTILKNDGFLNEGSFAVTGEGWRRVREVQAATGAGDTCFVAFWFTDDLPDLFPALARAAELAGWGALRVNDAVEDDRLTDRLEVEIRRARFVIADATGDRPNVFWEAGFARGLGKPVIWTSRTRTEKEKMQFDTLAFHHLFWKEPKDVIEDLKYRILRVAGQGPRPIPAA